MRLQRSVLFQPLLPPPLRPDADGGAGEVKRLQAKWQRFARRKRVKIKGLESESDNLTQLAASIRVTI
jgi:hypothetical protein